MQERESRTILLVDGSASILASLTMLLKRLEYQPTAARSAEAALRMMEASLPSLILTELDLPQMDGVQFLKKVKDTSRFKAIPVVMLTAKNDPVACETCSRAGGAAFLKKPVEPDLLYRTLQSASESAPRSNIRLSTTLKVVVGDGSEIGGAIRTEFATHISEGGLYVRTPYPQPRNALTPLTVFFNDRAISAKAVVLYAYSRNEGPFGEPGMGMKFVEISDQDRAYIRAFIRERLTSNIGSL